MRGRAGLLAALLLLAGCGEPWYLARLGWSEARLLLRREPIGTLLAEPDLDSELRARLALVVRLRAFARDTLGLRVGESFATFAAVDGDEPVFVVSAAPRDRLVLHTWWYPIVGRAPYRGFFDREAAEAEGRALEARGLDTVVRPAVAFSTLGWFADPLLSTTAAAPPVPLAETVLHELFHATVYVPGRTAFNESAATFAGHRGAVLFFCAGPAPEPGRCTEARRRWAAVRARGRVLERLADRLRRLFAEAPPVASRERTRTGLSTLAAAALDRRGLQGREDLLPPNNARLLGELLYATRLDDFDRLAPRDADLPRALAALAAAKDADDPFAVVGARADAIP